MAETEEKIYLVNVESNLDKYAADAAKAADEVDKLTIENVKLKGSSTATKEEIEKSNAALRSAKKEYTDSKKLVDLQTQANNSNTNSRKQLNAIVTLEQRRLGALANTYTINSKGVRELSQDYINQVKRLKEAKDAVISYDKAQSDGRSSVGLYSEAIQGAVGNLNMLPGPLGSAVTGIKGITTAAKAFIATPIGIILAAVTAAVGLLTKAFKNSQPLMDAFHNVSEAISATFKVLIDRVSNFAEFLGSIFSKSLRESRNAAKELNDELIGIEDTMSRREKRELRRANKKGLFKEIRDEAKAAKDLNKAEQELEDTEIGWIQRKAELQRQIQENINSSKDENLTNKEMLANLDAAIAMTKELTDKEVAIAKERARISQERTNQGNSTREELRANELLQSAATEAEAAGLKAQKKILSERLTIINKIKGEDIKGEDKKAVDELKKQAEAAAAKLKEEVKAEKKALEERLKLEKEYNDAYRQIEAELADWEKNRKLQDAENELAILEQKNANIFEVERARLDHQRELEIEAAIQTGADVLLIKEKYANASRQIDEAEATAKLDLYNTFAGNLATIFGENTAIGKAAAIAQTTIATYTAAMEAYKSVVGVPVIGPVLAVAAAGAAVAAGIANIKKIVAVKSGLPGDSGGSAPTSLSASFPAQHYTASGANLFTQPQYTQSELNSAPNQGGLTNEGLVEAIKSIPPPIVTIEDINAKAAEKAKVEVRATI